MTDTHASEHHGPGLQAYLVVFGALSIFTAVSFVVNSAVRNQSLTATAGFTLILSVAIIKAVLVGLYFMHLVTDWGKLYYLVFPAFILGAMMITVLLPDIVLGWSYGTAPAQSTQPAKTSAPAPRH